MPADLFAAFRHKSLDHTFGERAVRFDIPSDVFSTFKLDAGSLQLLKAMQQAGRRWPNVLDLGCGYGTLLIGLATMDLIDRGLGIERDALAAEYAKRNASANGFERIECRGGVAYDDVPERGFDVVVTNLPAKALPGVHDLFLRGCSQLLNSEGELWAVVVAPLVPTIDALLDHPAIELKSRTPGSQYALYRCGFHEPIPWPEHPYLRQDFYASYDDVDYDLHCLDGVDDFDSLWHGTDLLLRLLPKKRWPMERVAIWEPTQGHLPAIVSKLWPELSCVQLASRDRLSLVASRDNLRRNGFAGDIELSHGVGFAGPTPDVALVQLQGREETDLHAARLLAARELWPGVAIAAAGPAPLLGRVEALLEKRGMKPQDRLNRKGFRAIAFDPIR